MCKKIKKTWFPQWCCLIVWQALLSIRIYRPLSFHSPATWTINLWPFSTIPSCWPCAETSTISFVASVTLGPSFSRILFFSFWHQTFLSSSRSSHSHQTQLRCVFGDRDDYDAFCSCSCCGCSSGSFDSCPSDQKLFSNFYNIFIRLLLMGKVRVIIIKPIKHCLVVNWESN